MKYLNWSFYAASGMLVLSFLITFISFYNVDHLIIVHFDAFKGIDFLGTKYDVFGILAVSAIIVAVNALLARALYFRDRFLAWSVAVANLALSLIVLVAMAVIVLNN